MSTRRYDSTPPRIAILFSCFRLAILCDSTPQDIVIYFFVVSIYDRVRFDAATYCKSTTSVVFFFVLHALLFKSLRLLEFISLNHQRYLYLNLCWSQLNSSPSPRVTLSTYTHIEYRYPFLARPAHRGHHQPLTVVAASLCIHNFHVNFVSHF